MGTLRRKLTLTRMDGVSTSRWPHLSINSLKVITSPHASRAEGGHLLLPAPRGLHGEARHHLARARGRVRGTGKG